MVDADCVCNVDELKTEELAKDTEYVKEVAAVVEEWVSTIILFFTFFEQILTNVGRKIQPSSNFR